MIDNNNSKKNISSSNTSDDDKYWCVKPILSNISLQVSIATPFISVYNIIIKFIPSVAYNIYNDMIMITIVTVMMMMKVIPYKKNLVLVMAFLTTILI